MADIVLEARHLVKRFDDLTVLRDISLAVHEGEVIVIVGPSGCGKSTFLRCINALEDIQGGEILLNGEPVSKESHNLASIRQKIGMVFQSYELFPHLNVLDNITLAPVKVQNLPCKGAEIAPEPINNVVKHSCKHSDKYLFHLDAAQQVGPIRQEEKREFYRIFFEKNAADPAAQVTKFVNYYESLGWENADGRRYDTPAKRRGLAMMWECKGSAPRLTADFGTVQDKENQAAANRHFLKMLGELYELAASTGDPEDPTRLLNPGYRCRISWKDGGKEYDLIWSGPGLPVQWYDRHPEVQEIIKKHFGGMQSVIFNPTA